MKATKVMLLDLIPPQRKQWDAREYLDELVNLTQTAGGLVVTEVIQRRGVPDTSSFIGSGKLEEAMQLAKETSIDIVVVNALLKNQQLLFLQKAFKLPIWDKVDLILNIFDRHAKTDEAKLQIKLAKLKYQIPRVYTYHATTLFERSGSGRLARGAGEKGIEDEKRHLRSLIKEVEKKLLKIQANRQNQRKMRERKDLPMVAVVGYTNAGKSTLMRAMTKKDIYIADELFATLDTRIGRIWSEKLKSPILIADTIGFLRDLPPFLIESFRATLDEAKNADIILHVFDGSDPKWHIKVQTTQDILKKIGADHIPILLISNKSDLGCPLEAPSATIYTSATNKAGLEACVLKIEEVLMGKT